MRARAAAVEVGANNVRKFADAARVRDRNVKAVDGGVAAHTGERICQVGTRPVVVEAERQVVARGIAATAPASAACGRCAEAAVYANVEIIAVAVGGSYVMEVLNIEIGRASCRERV